MRKHPRGMALIQALLIVAAIAAVATALMLRAERARERLDWRQGAEQATLYIGSAVSLLRTRLPDGPVNRRQDWARPRDGIEIDRGFLAWEITDLSGRFNLNLLKADEDGRWHAAFRLLAEGQGLSDDAVTDILAEIDSREDAEPISAPLFLRGVVGDARDDWDALLPFLTALPRATALNINTMSDAVFAALTPDLPGLTRDAILRQVQREPADEIATLNTWIAQRFGDEVAAAFETLPLGTTSRYFEARIEARLDTLALRRSVVIDTGGPEGDSAVLMSLPELP
ncbi:general secretion pathway protein GspK [Pararhodobacter zhoushanensis]|uniref:general secretion pathway protein GspK n=1 Tax=Pararhodobacter zhoushanensis TaxID=2479545 RepID=UPI000F8E898F|nr:type II secretion system protein GspK [Pararhodobacter zhoushanensis]